MSQSTKRKHVTKELLDDNFELPKENQKIVRIVAGRGNNLHQVIEADEKTTYLVSMPNKFRKNVWVKRGNYCIVEPIEEGDKVKAEIVRILYKVLCTYVFLLIIKNMVQILVF
jgi:probable RNA-binding protein EIF1AD